MIFKTKKMKTRIKKYITLLIISLITISGTDGQMLLKNGVSASFGLGFSGSSHTIHSFNIGYQREISKALYIHAGYSNIHGSQSFKSLFGEAPKVNQYGEFGEGFQVYNDEQDYIFGRLIQVKSWELGLKKFIQLGSKLHMAGSISVVTSGISEIDIEGFTYDDNGNINYDEARPVYGTYNKISDKVGFELLYNLKDAVNIVSKVDYLSFESLIAFSLGTMVSF